MGAADLRVDLEPILEAFGVPATVTRPAPDNAPIETTVIWLTPGLATPSTQAYPLGQDLQRMEQERALLVPLRAVPTVPRDTVIAAPEVLGGPVLPWLVDSTAYADADHRRVFVVPAV